MKNDQKRTGFGGLRTLGSTRQGLTDHDDEMVEPKEEFLIIGSGGHRPPLSLASYNSGAEHRSGSGEL